MTIKNPSVDRALVSTVRSAITKMLPGMSPIQMRARIIELCNKKKYDPIEAMIAMAQAGGLDPDAQIAIHRELAQYVAPKVRAVEVTGDVDVNINVTVRKFDSPEYKGKRDLPAKVKKIIEAEVVDGD